MKKKKVKMHVKHHLLARNQILFKLLSFLQLSTRHTSFFYLITLQPSCRALCLAFFFVSNLAERSANGAKLIYEVFFHPESDTFIPAKLTAWQLQRQQRTQLKQETPSCAHFEQEMAQMIVAYLFLF